MTDPRYTDPPTDPRLREPVVRDDVSGGGAMWGWIAGIAVLILIVFVLIGGWNGSGPTTASNPASPAATTGSAPARAPAPITPAPATPAPAPAPAPAAK